MESISRLFCLEALGAELFMCGRVQTVEELTRNPLSHWAPSWFKDSTRRIEFRILEGHFLPLGCLLWSGLSQPTGVECV